jgi:thymidylate synthase (FAD)
MNVALVDSMGTDLSVVNAARVSFSKTSDVLTSKDENLIGYLAKHNHWTPFAHTAISLRIKAPIFVARQLGKHQIGLVWNEVSRRYVDDAPEFYYPKGWRGRAASVKQGSSDTLVEGARNSAVRANMEALAAYTELLDKGVCPEQARMVLPQSMYTEWIWTGNVASFARVCKLRLDPHTQKETRDVAILISNICESLFPTSWKALT